jgi:YVTN family beta-propeller protein
MKTWREKIGLAAALAAALLAGGCGGGSGNGNGAGSGGSGGSGSVTVNISPSLASVALNGTQQFVALVTGARQISIASSNGVVRAANIVTVTTTEAHNLAVGNSVQISGVTDTLFNGTFTVASVPSSTTFTYAQNGADTSSGGGHVANVSVNWLVNDVPGGNQSVGTITTGGLYTAPAALPPPATVTITASGAVRASNVVTITTSANHNLLVGQIVVISGVTDSSFNGTFAVAAVPSSTTFQYSQNANNANSGNGSVASFSVKVKAVSLVSSTASATTVVNLLSGVALRVSPPVTFLGTSQTFQFSAIVTGTSNTQVNWDVNGVPGGNDTVGTITPGGLFRAPATPPTSNTVNINSNGAVRASNVVTITTATAHGFTSGQSVVIAGVSDSSFNGTFTIATITSATAFTYAQTGPDATSGGGTASSTSNTVTVRATSVVDPTVSATSLVFVLAAGNPTLDSVTPTRAAQGSLFFDILLTGTNFLSTSQVRVNGTPVPASFATTIALSARIPQEMLQSPGTLSVDVQQQNGATTTAVDITVSPVRPALVGPSPDSATQGGGAVSVNFNGGYYIPSLVAEFDGQPRVATLTSSRQLNVAVGAPDLATAGLFSVAVRNPDAAQQLVATNLAVQPSAPPAVQAVLPVGTQPVAVAVNEATGIAVVVNRGSNNVTLINLATLSVAGTVPVGAAPTGVAIDNLRNVAVVVNSGSRNLSIVNLAAASVSATIENVGTAPVSVGVNPLTGLGLVASQSTNSATIFDLNTNTVTGTVTLSTGESPQVAIEPRLNWALVTPGGAGNLAIVHLERRSVLATLSAGAAVRGIAFNAETSQALLVDPSNSRVQVFSLLDQTVRSVELENGHVAGAVNPLTNVGVTVNPTTDLVSVLDLRTPLRQTTLAAGTDPRAVAIDPGSNLAIVASEGSNDVTLIALGAIRPLHVVQLSPSSTFTSSSDLSLTVTGHGFASGAVVRFDGVPVATAFVSSRRLTATVPASLLSGPRHFAVDVENSVGTRSNVAGFSVLQAVAVGQQPRAVAIDPERDLAVVTNSGSGSVSLINLNTGTVTATVPVGTNPQGVAIYVRGGRAVVSNRGSGTASVVDLAGGTVVETVKVGSEPLGVAVDEHSSTALVANTLSNSLSIFSAASPGSANTMNVDERPVAVGVFPGTNRALVAHATQNTLTLIDFDTTTVLGRLGGIQLPTAVDFDPVSQQFLVLASLSNNLLVVNPETFQATPVRVGINPTSLGFNFQSSTLVTVNSASRTVSVMDFLDRRVRAIFSIAGSAQFAVAIHPRSNLAVIVDGEADRVLLVPLPR